MAQGEKVRASDVCRVEKFEGRPGKLKKVGESGTSLSDVPQRQNNQSIMPQPKFDNDIPKFQGKVNI